MTDAPQPTVLRKDEARLVLAVVLNQISQGVYITLPYTLAVYIVRAFLAPDASEHAIGRHTGALVSLLDGPAMQYLLLTCVDTPMRPSSDAVRSLLCTRASLCLALIALGARTCMQSARHAQQPCRATAQ